MSDNYVLKNLMEDFVDRYVDEYMQCEGMCMCERCQADVRAHALNRLAPRYIVSSVGEVMVRNDAQSSQGMADIVAAIAEAIKLVKDHPRH